MRVLSAGVGIRRNACFERRCANTMKCMVGAQVCEYEEMFDLSAGVGIRRNSCFERRCAIRRIDCFERRCENTRTCAF